MNVERKITSKFGGSSMADAQWIERSGEIVRSNPDRRFIVVSAPGKRWNGDDKITDLLLKTHELASSGLPFDQAFDEVANRFGSIGRELQCHSVFNWLDEVHKGITKNNGKDWIASRGEWLMARVFANFLGGSFVDADKLIKLKNNGTIDPLSYQLINEQLSQDSVYVIPGFYGFTERRRWLFFKQRGIKVFARGGGDYTGAIIARGTNSRLYENWTDVDGLFAIDPRLFEDAEEKPKLINEITHREIRELGYRGAEVLQKDTVLPVFEADIAINLLNTRNPLHPGTMIRRERKIGDEEGVIGIAGKSGFVAVQIEKFGMNELSGVGSKIFEIFRDLQLPYEQVPMGLDAMSIIVREEELREKEHKLIDAISRAVSPTNIDVIRNLGVVCLVGEGIGPQSMRITSQFSDALDKAGIRVLQNLSYGTSGNNIVIGINGDEVKDAIRILYTALIA